MYLSRILNSSIYNRSGDRVGKVSDLVVTNLNSPLPSVKGVAVKRNSKSTFYIPADDCMKIDQGKISMRTDTLDFTPFERREGEVLIAKEVLDKQIVDVKERQLTRINDIILEKSNNNILVDSVDVSFRSILNRLKIPTWGLVLKYNTIPWEDIQFMGVDFPVKVKIDYDRLESFHPAEIARFIFRGPGYRKGTQIIQSLETEIAADVMETLPIDLQVSILSRMSPKSAAKILSEMESDHAADLLLEFKPEAKENFLNHMELKQVEAVKTLLNYPEGTAGYIMKLEYMRVPQDMTVDELYRKFRTYESLPEFLSYIYVTESSSVKKVVGVVSIWELFKAQTSQTLKQIMIKNLVVAKPLDKPLTVLRRMSQYDLSAIPVVGKTGHILGIVTLHEAIAIILPAHWKTRIGMS